MIYVLWNTYLLSSFSWLFFYVLFFIFLKPKLLYQYLFVSLQKQQLRGILLNIYVFNLTNSTKLCSLLTTFVNTQETFQRGLTVVTVMWRHDVGQCQINFETALYISTLKFTMPKNVKSTLSISVLILTTLDNVETMLLFSTSSFMTLINVETTLWIWPFSKSWKEQKNIFELQKKDESFD